MKENGLICVQFEPERKVGCSNVTVYGKDEADAEEGSCRDSYELNYAKCSVYEVNLFQGDSPSSAAKMEREKKKRERSAERGREPERGVCLSKGKGAAHVHRDPTTCQGKHMCIGMTHSARSPGACQVCLNANITHIFCVFF